MNPIREQGTHQQDLAAILESITDAFFALDKNWRFTHLNSHAEKMLARRRDDLLGKVVWDELPGSEESVFGSEYRRAVAEQKAVQFEAHYPPLDTWFEVRAFPAVDGLSVYFRAINTRRKAEQLLRESERRYRTLIEAIPQLSWTCLPDGDCDYLSSQWVEYSGIAEEAQLGLRWLDLVIHPDDRERTSQAWARAVADEAPYDLQYRLRRHDGVYRWFQTRGRPVRNENGQIVQWFGTCTDIDDQVRSEQESMRATEELKRQWREFDTALSNSPDFIYLFDLDGRFTYANRGLQDLLQVSFEQIIGKNFYDLNYPPQLADQLQEDIAQVIRSREPLRSEVPFQAPGGKTRQYEYIFRPVFAQNGEIHGVAGSTRDVTERKESEQKLRDSQERLRFALQSGRMASWEYDPATNRLERSPEFDRIFGDRPVPDNAALLECVVPEDRATVRRAFLQAIAQKGSMEFEVRIRVDGDELRWIWVRGHHYRESGNLLGLISDVTERKHLEERLREAGKLESIGVLAGGIAHDFNNLLTGVLGNCSLALEGLGSDHEAYPLVQEAFRAGERAAGLTKQMLAYSGRGKFQLCRLDLSDAIREISTLIKASIPPTVWLQLDLAANLPPIEADPVQIQQVIMNLVINGAEAIGDQQGTVQVNTRACYLDREYLLRLKMPFDIEPGNYVGLEVSDDGCGMSKDTQKRIFDPFFTTKFTGRGLGLSAVLGILRGHKGAMHVESELGKGTRFQTFFPAAEGRADMPDVTADANATGAGTVLLVDDERTVLLTATRILERAGFAVICAENGAEAVRIFRDARQPIDAVVLDMSMPVLDGEKALPILLALRPGARIVLSSGYSQSEALGRFSGRGLSGFLQKPYSAAGLLGVLREMGLAE